MLYKCFMVFSTNELQREKGAFQAYKYNYGRDLSAQTEDYSKCS